MTFAHLNTPASVTGQGTASYAGALFGEGVSVQGNILASKEVLQAPLDVIQAAQREKLPLYETLMRALEAGSAAGGDTRCGEQRATSAFVTVARPDDSVWNPYLNLVVHGVDPGSVNAVTVLRAEYERWEAGHQDNRSTQWYVMPPAMVGQQ